MVGGFDLQTSLGLEPSPSALHHPLFLEAIETIQRAADAHGLAVLGGAQPATLQDRLRLGWRAFICGTDAAGIVNWGTQALGEYKAIIAAAAPKSNGTRNGVAKHHG